MVLYLYQLRTQTTKDIIMGTSNFAYKDTLYAVEIEEDFEREFLRDELQELMNTLEKKATSKNKTIELDIYALDTPKSSNCYNGFERNFPSSIYGRVVAKSTFMGIDLRIDLDILVRSGYYEHVNIDYEWELEAEGNTGLIDDGAHEILSFIDMEHFPEGLIEMNKKHLDKRLDNMRALVLEAYHHIGKSVATEYRQAARFSDGTTMYEKASDEVKNPELMAIAA
jgi:hypothetical protein